MKKILTILLVITFLSSCKKEDVCRTCEIHVHESFTIVLSNGDTYPYSYSFPERFYPTDICGEELWDRLMENKDKFTIKCD